jgi:pimeloyl-ACP methyl ester carboxylesterase
MTTSWLLLRGLGREKRHWGSFPERLADASNSRVLALDLPGFGTENARSSPRTIDAIAEDVRERFLAERTTVAAGERWSVLGISLGGMAALSWCARHPDDFERCVTVNTSARPSRAFDRFRWAGVRSMVSAARAGNDAVARERAVLALTSDHAADELDALAQKYAEWRRERPPHRGSIALQLAAATTFAAPRALRPDALVLASKTDRLVSHRCSEDLAAWIGARVFISERGGHDLALDEPDWIVAKIAQVATPAHA